MTNHVRRRHTIGTASLVAARRIALAAETTPDQVRNP
jgi:hypothetical protein